MAEMGYAGRSVLVFGAAGALGSGLVAAFAQAGAVVTGADMHEPSQGRRLFLASPGAHLVSGAAIPV